MELFKWIRAAEAEYDLANSGVAPIETEEVEPPPLEQLVAAIYGVEADEVALTSGAQEGVYLAYLALRPRKVATVYPEYEPIWRLPEVLGVEHKEYPTPWDVEFTPGTVLIFSNPNNPTGGFLTPRELWDLSDEARRRGSYLVVDIIFSDFVAQDLKNFPLENVVYAHSTDKFYTSRLRVGWALAERAVAERIRLLKDLINPGPRPAERGAGAALLAKREEIRRRNYEIIDKNASLLLRLFPRAVYNPHMPIALVPTQCDDYELATKLLKAGVKTVPGRYFKAPRSIRIGLGVEPYERFEKAAQTAAKLWC
ncbi:MAG: aminotransferase class I/II-fold pyridoxal phosphate-dependent enzyme [Pyrobaculum sp.]